MGAIQKANEKGVKLVEGAITTAYAALIGMPIVFATFGFVAGAMGALLYNLAANWVGGIEMDLELK